MKIRYCDLIEISQILNNFLSSGRCHDEDFDILYDFYWVSGERWDLQKQPELLCGSIEHDIERIIECIQEKEPMSQHFRYFGNVLIAIADTLESKYTSLGRKISGL